jgi:hypothetical protein
MMVLVLVLVLLNIPHHQPEEVSVNIQNENVA